MTSVTKLGGWTTKPLIEVATLQRGYDLPVQDRADGPFPIFAANGPVGFHSTAKCRGPGVVTGRSGTIGKVHFVKGDYWPLNTSLYVTNFHGNDPRWVYYMLQSFGLERFSQGAGVPTLNRNLIHGEPVKVPPVCEQRRIAAILDKADALRTKRRNVVTELDRLAQSIFVEMFGDPATNPRGWPWRSLGSLAKKFSDGPFGSNLKSEHYVDDGVRVVRLQNIGVGKFVDNDKAYISHEHFERIAKHECVPGDILVGTLGDPNLRACVLPATIPLAINKADCVQIRVQERDANAAFVCALLNHPSTEALAQSLMHGQTRVRISMGSLRELLVPVPPLPLQDDFDKRIRGLDLVRAIQLRAMTEQQRLFESLQQRAFAGEL